MFQLVLLTLVASASANVYMDSKCPEVKAVETFKLAAYAKGKWYEAARYPNSAENNSNCGCTDFTLEGAVFKFKNSAVTEKKITFIEGSGRLAEDAANTGKFILSLPYGISGKQIENELYIMSTDYDNYAIGYYCKYDEERRSRQDFAWILSRTKSFSSDIKTEIDNFMKESKVLDSSKFVWIDFSDETCNIKA